LTLDSYSSFPSSNLKVSPTDKLLLNVILGHFYDILIIQEIQSNLT
jgi:hypothetical protein